jgi:hypothetical protein
MFREQPPSSGKNPRETSPQYMERDRYGYEYFLGVNPSELVGKRVLNIGSGDTGIYEKDLAQKGIDVITMSPYLGADNFGAKRMRENYTEKISRKMKRFLFKGERFPSAIAGWAEALPIVDQAIDEVFALYSVPLYSEKNEYTTVLQEIFRVLRDPGKARLYPLSKEMIDDLKPVLETMPVKCLYEPVAENESDRVFRGEVPYRLTITKEL